MLKTKKVFHCPCGFCGGTLRDEDEAVSLIQLHVNEHHTSDLPFGITREEALALVTEERVRSNERRPQKRLLLVAQ